MYFLTKIGVGFLSLIQAMLGMKEGYYPEAIEGMAEAAELGRNKVFINRLVELSQIESDYSPAINYLIFLLENADHQNKIHNGSTERASDLLERQRRIISRFKTPPELGEISDILISLDHKFLEEMDAHSPHTSLALMDLEVSNEFEAYAEEALRVEKNRAAKVQSATR